MSYNFLNEIVTAKQNEISLLEKEFAKQPLPSSKPSSFKQALQSRPLSIIAEIKRKSPSAGVIRSDFHPTELAVQFEQKKVQAISVLTDSQFFGGSFEILKKVSEKVSTPLLCKDFIFHPIQIRAAAVCGASAILLIVAMHSSQNLKSLHRTAQQYGLDTLFEVHNEQELNQLIQAIPVYEIVGVNNRDLKTFEVDLQTSHQLAGLIPKDRIMVCESGITQASQIPPRANAVLIGTGIAQNPSLLQDILQETSNET